jgi:hypothetical protein
MNALISREGRIERAADGGPTSAKPLAQQPATELVVPSHPANGNPEFIGSS